MKLSIKESKKICWDLDLGKFKSIKLIKGGLVNFNFILKTDKGEFIIRMMGQKITPGKQKRLNYEFELMEFLNRSKFPYLTPYPIKSNTKRILHKINNKDFWVYKKLPGKSKTTSPNLHQVKELAKALATYHKYVKNFKIKKNGFPKYLKWVLEEINNCNPKKNKDKIEDLALKEKDFFKKIVQREIKRNYSKNVIASHSDFDASNVLFKGNKIIGIIDFDDFDYSPKIRDIAVALRDSCTIRNKLDPKRTRIFLDEYKKVNKLSKEEESLIPNMMLAENAAFFIWAYSKMKKEKENRYKFMREMSIQSRNLLESLK
ncbi:MAG: phosphotransferase [archaeon]